MASKNTFALIKLPKARMEVIHYWEPCYIEGNKTSSSNIMSHIQPRLTHNMSALDFKGRKKSKHFYSNYPYLSHATAFCHVLSVSHSKEWKCNHSRLWRLDFAACMRTMSSLLWPSNCTTALFNPGFRMNQQEAFSCISTLNEMQSSKLNQLLLRMACIYSSLRCMQSNPSEKHVSMCKKKKKEAKIRREVSIGRDALFIEQ